MLNVRVQAGARKERILGQVEGDLRVAIQAPPVEGAANRALIRFLAKVFGTSRSRVRLLKGERSKIKTIEFDDFTSEELRKHVLKLTNN